MYWIVVALGWQPTNASRPLHKTRGDEFVGKWQLKVKNSKGDERIVSAASDYVLAEFEPKVVAAAQEVFKNVLTKHKINKKKDFRNVEYIDGFVDVKDHTKIVKLNE